jgi:hypothetical protein
MEVIDGMGVVIDTPSLLAICLEVHYGILAARGKAREPARMVRCLRITSLRSSGWTDFTLSLSDDRTYS